MGDDFCCVEVGEQVFVLLLCAFGVIMMMMMTDGVEIVSEVQQRKGVIIK